MIYSFSRLSLYESCPYKFYLRYIEGREEPQTEPRALGKAVHKGIEMIINDGISLEEAVYKGLVETDFFPLKREEVQWLIQNAGAEKGMGETEVYFCVPLSDSPSAPQVQGYIDLITPEGFFVDWKTNRKPYGVWNTMQLPLYAWALMKLRNIHSIVGSLFFLRFRRRESTTFDLSDGEKARLWAYDTAMEIEEKLFLLEMDSSKAEQLFPATPSGLCKYCPFVEECYKNFGRY
ncbi:PD-(D/E)XK nuclease family protein [Microaerobacter geothermalis]|uniref:PD-(D/E)XK nuclease family protein n=1 Tax=Microaerobacter geothermalis TaxID=674972 RepID=UPI001F188E6C|nr:PD-(D/E)XK nuclease family protein [Microaerobacter geothermalis]MCF6094538.1 PD-(D/E)XK nuclease family protein [Microaerobacter geothermalis]